MVVTLFGIATEVKLVLMKAAIPMVVILLGNVTDFRELV
jgi:hypothetical protein